jgi:pyridoxine 4-dehydrogenase
MSTQVHTVSAARSGTFALAGELPVNRLGFGAMRITGEGIWGPPRDKKEALAVLRRSVELGVNFMDTADSYGPNISEELIAEALHPYPKDLVIATSQGSSHCDQRRVAPARPEPVDSRLTRLLPRTCAKPSKAA